VLKRHDTAIDTASDFLVEGRGDKVAMLNILGHAHRLKGNLKQAAFFYKQALDLDPDNPGLQRMLDEVRPKEGQGKQTALGRVDDREGGTRGAGDELDVDDLYWMK
jgi:hypothetical protein